MANKISPFYFLRSKSKRKSQMRALVERYATGKAKQSMQEQGSSQLEANFMKQRLVKDMLDRLRRKKIYSKTPGIA